MPDLEVASSPATAASPAAAPAPAEVAATPAPAPAASTPAEPVAAAPSVPADPPAPAPSAPESYDFKVADGASAFDDKVIGAYSDAAKSLNLTQDGAQALLDKVAPVIQAQQIAKLTEYYADIGGMPDTWEAQTKADKEIGGDKLGENLAIAAKARDLGGPEFVKLLHKTGLGNHPAVIKTFMKIGKALSEEKFVSGAASSATPKTQAERMYGGTAPKS